MSIRESMGSDLKIELLSSALRPARGQAKETRLIGTVHVFQENGACAILEE